MKHTLEKTELRRQIRALKSQHVGELPALSENICEALLHHPRWQQAESVLAYSALPDEPSLTSLLQTALQQGKRVLLPVVVGDDLVLRLYQGQDALHEGAFSILEPQGEDFPLSRYPEIDLVLVPGVAFDKAGHRLGRGRGYYDRLLPRLPQAFKLGVCFPFQIIESVPTSEHDISVDETIIR